MMLLANLLGIIVLSDFIDQLAMGMYVHFDVEGTSTRSNLFLNEGDFIRNAPLGMIIAFIGPTLSEMIKNPLSLIAGVEGVMMIGIFMWLSFRALYRMAHDGYFSPVTFFSITITVVGILFLHYPFGIFNPGSAIRYRTNFIFLFIILFSYLYAKYKKKEVS